MDEKELKKLEDQLENLGKTIDSKLEDFGKKAKDASAEDMAKIKAEMKKEMEAPLKEYQEKNAKLQEQIDGLETSLKRVNMNPGTSKKTFKQAIGDALTDHKGFKSLKEKTGRTTGEIFLKVDDMTQANSFESTTVVSPDYQDGIIFDPDRTDRIRTLITPGTTNSNAVSYVYEYSLDDNTDVTSEGAEYKQSDFDLKLATATVRKITAYILLSEELLEDVPGLQSYISARLPSKLKVKEDYQLLYGDGTGVELSGITTNATAYSDNLADADISRIDVLVDAARQVRDDEYKATAMLIHPTDATLIKLTKDDNGNYIHPWIFMPNGQITLDGIPVVVTTAITAGDFLVGDFKLGAQVFDRRQASLEMSYENEDNFVKGMVTVRISERLTLCVYRAKAFIYGTFTAALANGSA